MAAAAVAVLAWPGQLAGLTGHRVAPAAETIAAPLRFSPLIPFAAFGRLPHGVALVSGQIQPDVLLLNAGRGRAARSLNVYVAGRCDRTSAELARLLRRHRHPTLACKASADSFWIGTVIARARPVAGHPAFWTAGHGELAWEYARDSWATLSVPSGPGSRGQAIMIARHVRYRVATVPSIRFPVRLTGLPASWRVGFTFFLARGGVLRISQFVLTSGGPIPVNLTTNLATRTGACYVHPDGQSAHRVINGFHVTVSHLPARRGDPSVTQVCAAHADGLFVVISSYGKHQKPDAVAIFARHLTVLGREVSRWTTHPIG
jgi:hypothetical protein